MPTLSFVGALLTQPCFVSTSRSSNRTGGFPASGSRRKDHGVAHGKLRVRAVKRTKPSTSCNAVSGYCPSTEAPSLHRHYPISPVLRTSPSPRTARPVSRRFRPAGNWGLRCGAELGKIRTMDAIVRASTARERFLAALLLIAGAASTLLGAVGIYGVVRTDRSPPAAGNRDSRGIGCATRPRRGSGDARIRDGHTCDRAGGTPSPNWRPRRALYRLGARPTALHVVITRLDSFRLAYWWDTN